MVAERSLIVGLVAAVVALRWLWEARGKLAAGWHAFRARALDARAQSGSVSPSEE